jgi:hypothetical protein
VAAFWLLAIFAVPGHIVTWYLTEGTGFGEDDDEETQPDDIGGDIGLEATRLTQQPGLNVDAAIAAFEGSDKDDDDSDVEDVPLLSAAQKDWKG